MTIVDPKLIGVLNGDDKQAQQQQLHDILSLALLCVQDEYEVRPEISDFSDSITIPPEQLHVQDVVKTDQRMGTLILSIGSGYISEKTDVYSLGVTLLVFLMGRKAYDTNGAEEEAINTYLTTRKTTSKATTSLTRPTPSKRARALGAHIRMCGSHDSKCKPVPH